LVFVLKLSSFKAYFGVLISLRDSAVHHSSLLFVFQHHCEKGVYSRSLGTELHWVSLIYIHIYTCSTLDQQSLSARSEYVVIAGSAVAQRAFRTSGHIWFSSRFALARNICHSGACSRIARVPAFGHSRIQKSLRARSEYLVRSRSGAALRSVLSPGLVRTSQQHIARVIYT
jgi:hypothetical protein